jgi:L-aminopeptidase/D-esterase-like protein
MNCYGFKGGSGTASRTVEYAGTGYTVGVFVQANFGRRHELVITGIPLGDELGDDNPLEGFFGAPPGAGSIIAVVVTDAPLFPSQCSSMARRVTSGIARTGTAGSHSSGDLFVACSTANPGAFTTGGIVGPGSSRRDYDTLSFMPWGRMDPFFTAVVQATEEAVVNAMVANDDMTGRQGHRTPALPRERVAAIARQRSATS